MDNNSIIKNTIIVGAGVSGICLSYQLYKRKLPFVIYDMGQNHSSKVAAGIINPLVFRRMNKSWMVDEELVEAKNVYREMEQFFDTDFFHHLPFRRVFASEEESHWWNKRLNEEPEFLNYLKPLTDEDDNFSTSFNEYGTGRIGEAFAIDTAKFIEKAYAWLIKMNAFQNTSFEYSNIDLANKTYQGNSFDQIIFCEGYQNIHNPFFSYLPIDPTKGEILEAEIKDLSSQELLNRKCWIMPKIREENKFLIGATYQWETTDLSLSNEAKEDLSMKAKSLIKCNIIVIGQRAGIRPTTPDRRPIIGPHPTIEGLFILNGMGTKGYCHAPFWSKHLVEHIFEQKNLNAEVKTNRFKKKFYKEG